MKVCTDCLWFKPNSYFPPRCVRPTGKYDVVSGIQKTVDMSCDLERGDNWLGARIQGTCGKEGRFFEPKVESDGAQARIG